jgi:hypothetical protein
VPRSIPEKTKGSDPEELLHWQHRWPAARKWPIINEISVSLTHRSLARMWLLQGKDRCMPHTDDFFYTLLMPTPPPGPGTLWTLTHEYEGVVSVNVGQHPHGYELRLILNYRFLRSRVHRTISDVLVDAADTRHRFEMLGFEEVAPDTIH